MKYKDLKDMSHDQLKKLLAEMKGKLVLFRFHTSAGQESNVRKGRALRRGIARIATIMKQGKQSNGTNA